MINNTLNDATQLAILPLLVETEKLIIQAIKKETGNIGTAEIIAMPDLGLADNLIRMNGGFFTGMYLKWESKIPFVPVDATINSCGVSVYLLKNEISCEEFIHMISLAKTKIKSLNYNWNFERGNHFISLCQLDNGKYCVVMHASADEYKKSISDKSLYPVPNVWYYDNIKTVWGNGRYLRYLIGDSAERFISIATSLEDINHCRMNQIAELFIGNLIEKELAYIPHYGMPTSSSIAIGCSWKTDKSILLTMPQKSIYILRPDNSYKSPMWLTPHGFGVSIRSPSISYSSNLLNINGVDIKMDESMRNISGKGIRLLNTSTGNITEHVNKILNKCNAVIDAEIRPLISLNCNGFI